MQIVIEIPDDKLTQTQSVLDISLDIISGKVFSADGYGFCVLPKNHGRLIDADEVIKVANKTKDLHGAIWNAPTIIEAESEEHHD